MEDDVNGHQRDKEERKKERKKERKVDLFNNVFNRSNSSNPSNIRHYINVRNAISAPGVY